MAGAALNPVPSWERESSRFWAAAADGRLELQYCPACAQFVHYPRRRCPRCLSPRLEWRVSGGRGVIYSVTIVHRPLDEASKPHVVALIDLDEGVRLMSELVDCPPERIAIGHRVEVRFARRGDRTVPVFVPDMSA